MFRDRRTNESSGVLWITVALLIVMLAATGMTVWLITEVRKEQQAVQEIMHGGVEVDIERLGTMSGELRWQLVFSVLVLFVLMLAAFVLALVARAYLRNRTALRDIKILAGDILASMDDGVITTDQSGRVTSVNARAHELVGLANDCVGQRLDQVCAADIPLAATSNEVLRAGKALHDQSFGVTRNGHVLRIRADCHVLRDQERRVTGTVLHIRDVTESALIEDRMRRMERFMGLGTLAAGLHHEIKNPLSALSLHVQLLEEQLEGQCDEDVGESFGVLKAEVTRIAGVLESFRDYASFNKLSPSETDVGRLVQQTIELVRPTAQQQQVQIQSNLPRSDVRPIWTDAARLEQVVLNLVLNALDAMPSGGTLTLNVENREPGQVTLEVSDTGLGIPDNLMSKIFDPYFTTKSDGSGMGLAFCDKIIRQHGGQIDVRTRASGTTFLVSMPVDPN